MFYQIFANTYLKRWLGEIQGVSTMFNSILVPTAMQRLADVLTASLINELTKMDNLHLKIISSHITNTTVSIKHILL